jgi:hypothetical protein
MYDVFEITETDGLFYVAPMSVATNGTYLIVCETRERAELAQKELARGTLSTPLEDSSKYGEPTPHISGKCDIWPLS